MPIFFFTFFQCFYTFLQKCIFFTNRFPFIIKQYCQKSPISPFFECLLQSKLLDYESGRCGPILVPQLPRMDLAHASRHMISVNLIFPNYKVRSFKYSSQDCGRSEFGSKQRGRPRLPLESHCQVEHRGCRPCGVQARKASWSRLLDFANKIQDTQLNLNFR